MRKFTSFRPEAAIATLLLGGVLLAPMGSHGCQARGTSLHEEIPVASIQEQLETQAAGVLQWELSPSVINRR